jgi:hypothetical protein
MSNSEASELRNVLWRFVAGETPVDDFRSWVYEAATLEEVLGRDLYLDVLSADGVAEVVDRVRRLLSPFVRPDLLGSPEHSVGAERDVLWAPTVLPKLDAEVRCIEAVYNVDVIESCTRLLARFGPAANSADRLGSST